MTLVVAASGFPTGTGAPALPDWQTGDREFSSFRGPPCEGARSPRCGSEGLEGTRDTPAPRVAGVSITPHKDIWLSPSTRIRLTWRKTPALPGGGVFIGQGAHM